MRPVCDNILDVIKKKRECSEYAGKLNGTEINCLMHVGCVTPIFHVHHFFLIFL